MAGPYDDWAETPVTPEVDPYADWAEAPVEPAVARASYPIPEARRDEFAGEELLTREGELTVPDSLITPLEQPAPQSDRAERLRQILTATFDADPEREAGVLALARATRMRSDVADRNYDELRTAWEARNFDVDEWMRDHPHLANLVLDRPELGAVVRQDETLSAFSQAINKAFDVMGALDSGETSQFGETAEDRAKNREEARITPATRDVRQDAVVGAVAEDGPLARAAVPIFRFGETWAAMQASKVKTRIAIARTRGEPTFELEKQLHDLELEATPRAFGEGAWEQIGTDVAAGLASQAAIYEGMGPAEMAITALGAGIGWLAAKGPGGARKGATVGTRLAGAAGGGFKTATFVGSVELQFGDLYWELSQAKTDDGRVLSHEEAMGGAAIAAFLQAGVETVALEKTLSSGPLGSLLGGKNPKAALAELMKQPAFRSIAARAGKDLAKGAFWEGSEEFIQEIIGRAAVFGTRSAAAGGVQQMIEAGVDPQAALLLATAGGLQDWSAEDVVGALVAGLKAAEKGAIAGPAIASVSVMPDVMVQASTLERAQRNGELVAALGKLGDSPTVRAAPDAVAAMVERAAAEGGEPARSVYVDAEAFLSLFQEEKAGGFAGAAEAAAELLGPDGWTRVSEALATGDKVEVPLPLYLEKWGVSEVAKKLETHTTLDPTLPTIAQMEKQQAELEKEEPSPAEAEFLVVMEEQLNATGRAGSKKDVAAQILLWRQAVRTAARRFSTKDQAITPDELFRGIVLEVRQSEQRIGEAGITPMGGQVAAPAAQAASSTQPVTPEMIAMVAQSVPAASQTLSQGLPKVDRARTLYRDDVTGLRNRRAWDETERTPGKMVAVITSPDVKAINDDEQGGHDTTNGLLRTIGVALGNINPNAARSGTNFLLEVDDAAELQATLDLLREALPDSALVLEGTVAPTADEAFKASDAQVEGKRAAGVLRPRGETAVDLATLPQMEERFTAAALETAIPDALAQRAAALSPAEFFEQAYLDKDVPGLLNGTGWRSIPRKPFVASIDLKGLKKINDTLGKDAGNQMLAFFARIAQELGGADFDFAHLSGDEYAAQADSQAELEAWLADLSAELQDVGVTLTSKTGKTVTLNVEFRDGVGESYGAADRALNKAKRAGLNSSRDVAGGVRGPAGEAAGAEGGVSGSSGRDDLQRTAALEERRARAAGRGPRAQAFRDPQVGIQQAGVDALLSPSERFEQGEAARRVTETPEFRAWFGDSKVVDAEGKPLRVFHGTNKSFNEFDLSRAGEVGQRFADAAFFSSKPDVAAGYAARWLGNAEFRKANDAQSRALNAWGKAVLAHGKNSEQAMAAKAEADKATLEAKEIANRINAHELPTDGANVVPVYLSLQNPLEVDAKGQNHTKVHADAFRRAVEGGHDGVIIRNVRDSGTIDMRPAAEAKASPAPWEGLSDVYAVFRPEQVKSATGNRGTFDASDPSILNQEGASRTVRGHTDIARDGLTHIFSIALAKDADLSTFLHESGHVFMDLMAMLAQRPDAPESVKRDWQTMLTELGLGTTEAMQERREAIRAIRRAAREAGRDLTAAEQKQLDELVRPFEQFARMWEAYLREGKAPSAKLAGAFRRFRNWLVAIYRTLRDMEQAAGFPVILNDEVRGVFDRLLATDREIEAAKGRAGLSTPLYRSPEEAGMTPEEWVAYLKTQEEATTGAQMALEHRMVKDQLREMESWWKEEEARQRDIAKAEFEGIPARQAWRLIERRTLDEDSNAVINPDAKRTSLHRATVEGWLGAEKAKKFPLSKGGAHPDEFAPLFGFATGKEMIEAIASLPNKDGWVKERARERMLEKFPDIAKERDELQALADKGVQGDRTAKWLLAEWDALRRRAGKQPGTAPVDAIKRLAESIASKRAVGRLDVGGVLRIERSLAERAAKEAAKGNFAQAAVLKQQQLLNLYLHGALTRARDDRDELVDLSRRLSKDKARADLGKASPVYRDGVDLLLEAFGLGPEYDGRDRPYPSLAEVVAQLEADGATVAFDPEVVSALLADPKPWKDLSVAEARALLEALQNIQGAARTRRTALVDGKRVDRDEVVADLVSEAEKNLPDLGPRPSSVDAMSAMDGLGDALAGLHADILKPGTMIRWLGGKSLDSRWFRAIMLPLQRAKAREVEILRETIRPIVELFEQMPKDISARMNDLVDGKRLFPNHRSDISPPTRRFEILAMLFNMGNEGNLQRLLEGRGITEAQAVAAINEYLSPEIIEWAQKVLDQMDALWPLAAAVEERVTGLRPRKVQPRALHTRHGTFRGGYFPILYRSDVGDPIGAWQEGATLASVTQDPSFTRPGTSHGHLKERARKTNGAIDLRLSVIPAHLAQAAHDIAFREALLSVAGLMMDPRVRTALMARLGKARTDVFLAWLKDIGQMRGASSIAQAKGFTRLALQIRSNTIIGVLGWSARTALGDLANIPAALPGSQWELKPRHWMMGLVQFASNPVAAYRLAGSKSSELRTRRDQMQRELSAEIKKLTSRGPFARGPLAWFRDHAFTFMEWSDHATTTPVWLGRYRQAIAEGESEARAVELADDLLLRLWPSFNPVDLSAIARDKGFVGASLMFHGYANVSANIRLDIAHTIHTSEGAFDKTKAIAAAAATSLAFSASAWVLGDLIMGRGPEDDEEWEDWFLRKLLLAQLQDLPFAGDIANSAESMMTGKGANARASPMVEAANSVGRAVLAISDEDKEMNKKVTSALRAIGPITGIPTGAPARAVDYLLGTANGEQEADDPLDVAGGLIYGPKREE